MKVIETYWEKDNLGIDSAKYVIEPNDSCDEIEQAICDSDKEYLEAFVAPGCFAIVRLLEDHGFHYMETAIELKGNSNSIAVPRQMKRFVDKTTYTESTIEELAEIFDEIETGTMFVTDKISMNPTFGSKKAGHRYRRWVEGMLNRDAKCYSIKYEEKLIGFEVCQYMNDQVELCLGGGFPNISMGTGMMTVTAGYHYWLSQGVRSIITNVSSNNMPVLKLHEMFGLKVSNLHYVFINDQKMNQV